MCVPDFGRGRWSRGQPEGDPGSGAGRARAPAGARGVGGGPGRAPAGAKLRAFDLLRHMPAEGRTRRPRPGQGSIRSSFRCLWLAKVERVGPDRGQVSIRSTLCCLSQEKVERVGSRGDRAGPDARATTLLTQPRPRPRNRKPAHASRRLGVPGTAVAPPGRLPKTPITGPARETTRIRTCLPRQARARIGEPVTTRPAPMRPAPNPARTDAARTECGPHQPRSRRGGSGRPRRPAGRRRRQRDAPADRPRRTPGCPARRSWRLARERV
jgi:hypothetical protein